MDVCAIQGQKADLDRQVQRLKTYTASRGYQVTKIVQETASGVDDTRPKQLNPLTDPYIGRLVVEHLDRLTRWRRDGLGETCWQHT
jgi:putative resolvase